MKKISVLVCIGGIVAFTLAAGAEQARTESCRYESHGKRDPFTPLVGQGKSSAAVALEDVATISDVKLEGIASDPKGKLMAVLNGELVRQGARAGVVEVVAVAKGSIRIMIGDKEYTVNLIEEGGSQGD